MHFTASRVEDISFNLLCVNSYKFIFTKRHNEIMRIDLVYCCSFGLVFIKYIVRVLQLVIVVYLRLVEQCSVKEWIGFSWCMYVRSFNFVNMMSIVKFLKNRISFLLA